MKKIYKLMVCLIFLWTLTLTSCKKTYNITYNLDGGILEEIKTSVEEKEVVLLKTPTKDGYVFEGWYLTSDFSGEKVTTLKILDNINIYAKWIKINEAIIDADGGIVNNEIFTGIPGETIILSTPTKEGYTFDGWFLNYDFESTPINQYTFVEETDVVITAKWTPIVYEISYNLDDGINNDKNPNTYTIEDGTIILKKPTKEGYTFVAWYKNKHFIGDEVTQININDKNVELFAKFERGYKITYELNGGINEENAANRFYVDEEFKTPIPIKTKARFDGWYVDEALTILFEEKINTGISSELKLYAKWVNLYSIEYELRDGELPVDYLSLYEPGVGEVLPIPAKAGYNFMGWSDQENSDRRLYFNIPISYEEDLKLYAVWEKTFYNIEYILDEYTFFNKEQLYKAFFGDFYDYLVNVREASKKLNSKGIENKDDFLSYCQTFEGGAAGMGHIGNLLGTYFLTIDTGGKLENQKNKEGYIGYCLKNNMYVEFIYFLEEFFYYWRLEEGYTNSSSDPNGTGSDFLASAWASVVDTAKFFYYDPNREEGDPQKLPHYFYNEGDILPTFYDRIPYIYDTEGIVFETVYDWEKEIILPTEVNKLGYIFVGWYLTEDFSGEKITKIEKYQYHDIKLYAKFIEV